MKKKKLEKQYDPHAEKYTDLHIGENQKSTNQFFELVEKHSTRSDTLDLQLLDLGCGAGTDFDFYQSLGFVCHGIDASSEMCALAHKKYPQTSIVECQFDKKTIFPKESFGVIVSKWALQTTPNIQTVYAEVVRLLAEGGSFIFLTVHPLRQFLEKKKSGKNYFKQEIVASEIFNKQITVYEPTHTMQEYLSPYFLEHFELLEIKEDYEFPAAEQIGGDIYPTHLIVVARKK